MGANLFKKAEKRICGRKQFGEWEKESIGQARVIVGKKVIEKTLGLLIPHRDQK